MIFTGLIIGLTATIVSVVSLTRLAIQEHDQQHPRTLSELAAQKRHRLAEFRAILWFCGTLFAITVWWYINPHLPNGVWLNLAWGLTYISELLLSLVPATDGLEKVLHTVLARSMGIGMLATAFVFYYFLAGGYSQIELSIFLIMLSLSLATILDKKRFLLYELPFIFLSHVSILLAIVALR